MADVISLGTILLTKLNNVANTYDDVGRVAKSLQNLLSLVIEFMKIRVGISNPLDPELAAQLHDIFNRIDAALQQSTRELATYGRRATMFCSGVCGPFRGSVKALKDLRQLESELCTKLDIIKLDLLSNNSEMMSLIAGLYYDRPDTPQLFWHRMFRERQWVGTELFADTLCNAANCTRDVANYISATLSDRGCVHANTFFASFPIDSEFDIAKWVQNTQMQADARTVCIPAHVGCITEMAIVGNLLITSSHDCTLKVFEKHESLMVKSVMIGHEKEVNDFCVMANGHKVVSASMDGTLRMWSVESGEQQKNIKLKDIPYRIRAVDEENVVYLTRGSAYPIVLYNVNDVSVIKRFRCDHDDLWSVEIIPNKGAMHVSAFDNIYTISMRTYEHTHKVSNHSNIYIRNLRILEDDRLVCESETGISILERTEGTWTSVDIIKERTSLFKIPKIRVHNNVAYVLWIYGAQHRTSHLTLIDLDTHTRIGDHDLSLMKEGYCVNFHISLPFVYFATNRGNIYWYTLNRSNGEDSWEGHTFNDQMAFGHDFTNVCIATCDTGVVVCNNRELRFWNVATDTVIEKIIDCAAIGCVYFNNEFVVMDSTTLFFYNSSFLLLNKICLDVCMEKFVVSNDKLLILYSDTGPRLSQDFAEENTAKNLGVFSRRENCLHKITHLRPVSVLFSTPHSIFMSDTIGITICDAETLEVKQLLEFSKHTSGIAISGCQLNDRYYTLHSSNVILVWARTGSDLVMEKKIDVSISITELRKFNNHILGFSSIGTVFVFDGNLELRKCIVSHLSRTIHGTAYNNDNEVVVSDHRGVLKILAQMFSVSQIYT